MAAELVETSRLWARTVARIQPEWVEPLAGHLVKRTYSEPHWSRKRAGAVATERVTLHGVPIVVGRTVDLGRIDPEQARDLFLRHALVEGDWDTRHAFFAANRALLDDVEELETRARRRDLVVDEDTLFAFYDARVPAEVVSGRHFDTWWKRARRRHPDLLDLTAEFLTTEAAKEFGRVGIPGRRRGRRSHAAAVVRVRARQGDRRHHRRRAGRRAAPGRPHAVHLAGARAARGAGHRADQDAAQAAAAAVRARAGPRPRGAHPAAGPRIRRHSRTAARRAGARAGPDAQRHDPARRLGARPAPRAPDGHVSRDRRARPRGRARHGSGDAPARAGAEGPRGTGDRRCGHRGDRADHLDARDPPARDRRPARAARRHRLSGPRRPRHVGGRAGLPDGGRARPGSPARRPAAPAAGDPVTRPRGRRGTWTTPRGSPSRGRHTARSTSCSTTA